MVPEKIGRYEIKSELGRGGMATVFHAYDPRFERDVAVKVLPKALLHDPQFKTRFEREAKTIGLLEHPAIVPVYDFGEEDGQPYIVMRLMTGGDLASRMKNGQLSKEEVSKIVNRLAPALDAAHQKGIIHRDLKPGNILFDQYGNSFLSDFGIARLAGSAATLTGSAIIGTPAYMSPEQVQGDKEIDGRSDIYALGVILYQMLTGRMPYEGDTPAKVMMMHILEPVPNITEVDPDLPEGCDRVIEHAMAKEPDSRYENATELAEALTTAISGEMPAVKEGTPATRVATGPLRTVVGDPGRTSVAGVKSATQVPEGTMEMPVSPDLVKPPRAIGGAALFGIVALIIVLLAGGGLYMAGMSGLGPLAALGPASPSPTPTPSAEPTLTHTPAPSLTVPPPTDVPLVILDPTDTPPPTLPPTETAPPTETPTATPTATPAPPMMGSADKIAFLHQNDIWIANLDGTELSRLTVDGGQKLNLSWTPDGKWIVYRAGNCAKYVAWETGFEDNIACFESALNFEGFEVSPDGTQVAISLNRQLYVVPFDVERLQQVRFGTHLQQMGTCDSLNPYTRNAVKFVQWAQDSKRLAFVFLGNVQGFVKDLVHIIDIRNCNSTPPTLDEFPVGRFNMRGYDTNPEIQNFGWDGEFLFGMNGSLRNGGYGDLYIYNHDTHKGELINPIRGVCCYRDFSWSPDRRFFAVAFQDIGLGGNSFEELYVIEFGTLGTGIAYTPIPLPEEFLTNPREKPQPILRPAVN